MSSKAVIAIWGEGKNSSHNGESYVGIAELQSFGFSRVEIYLPSWVKPFPKLPYICLVDCDIMAEMRAGKYPLLTLTNWYEAENLIQNDNFKGVVK